MEKSKRGISIQFKFWVLIILITFGVFGAYAFYEYQKLWEEDFKELVALADRTNERLAKTFFLPLWNMDDRAVESIVETELQEKRIEMIFVKREDNETLITAKRRDENGDIVDADELPDETPKGMIVRTSQVIDPAYQETIGHILFYVTDRYMRQALSRQLKELLITLVILDVILVIFTFVIFNRLLTRPISHLQKIAHAIASGDFEQEINVRRQDEIGKLANAFRMILASMRETAEAAEAVAAGNLEIVLEERSENDRMMQALNRMISRLRQIMDETQEMIQSVGEGKMDVRGNTESFEGGWRELVGGMNDLISGLRNAVSNAVALSQEMQMARQIQTSLLPRSIENIHPDFEIAADMLTADQVGGDFYDITYDRSGTLWIAIGDVSGHGVTPGLIMMMAQTVHTTMTTSMDCDAKGVVVMVNNILFKNVHERLNSSHFMTFMTLRHLGDGRFQHAGAHLSMIVYRQETRSCELIKSQGVYLNFKKDISKATNNSEFVLVPGDILVLYTDGLTEARTRDGNMLDIDGFINIVKKYVHLETETMKRMILTDVIQCCDNTREDDMTIVIVKRKATNDA